MELGRRFCAKPNLARGLPRFDIVRTSINVSSENKTNAWL